MSPICRLLSSPSKSLLEVLLLGWLIPLYNLHQAQGQLENIHDKDIVIYLWTPAEYFQITKICKLYDFERKCWTDFDGNPTSAPMPDFFGEN